MNSNDVLIAGWLDWLAASEMRPGSIRNRKYTLGTFAREHDLPTATLEDVQAHLAGLPGGAYSRQGHLAALKSFYRWCHLSGRCEMDPTALVRSVRVPAHQLPPVPPGILDRAILLASPEDRFMLLLGSRAGLRREEIATLHAMNVGADWLVITGKGGRVRRVPIAPQLRPHLDDLVADGGWAFPSHVHPGQHVSPETVQRHVSRALGDPWTTHSLRRYAATSWYRATLDVVAVQHLLGHASAATTAKYVQADDSAMMAAVRAVA